jgi:hypothetical protein
MSGGSNWRQACDRACRYAAKEGDRWRYRVFGIKQPWGWSYYVHRELRDG